MVMLACVPIVIGMVLRIKKFEETHLSNISRYHDFAVARTSRIENVHLVLQR